MFFFPMSVTYLSTSNLFFHKSVLSSLQWINVVSSRFKGKKDVI